MTGPVPGSRRQGSRTTLRHGGGPNARPASAADAALRFKIASTAGEFEQIHRLNYRSFVEEIPQHPPNPRCRLVDRFHDENTYVICLRGRRLIGMTAVRAQRPFSLDLKLGDASAHLPPGRLVCEIRLLAIEPARRGGAILRGMARKIFAHCRRRGFDLAIISGAVRQQKLYRHFGFVPFGPLVGTQEAPFQPMYLTLEDVLARVPWISRRPAGAGTRRSASGPPRGAPRTTA